MEFELSESDVAFRLDVRAFLHAHLPAEIAGHQRQGYQPTREDQQAWHRVLFEKGWAAPEWPVEHGGTGWTPVQRFLYEIEYGLADAPDVSVPGMHLVGPVICRFGSSELQARFLGPLLCGDIYCCQGFSEPEAGSDLANLRTRAIRDGDHYILDGQKTWTSEAHFADWIFCLARTDAAAKPQAGLSMILVPMDAPGLTVRPITTIDDCHHVNEVFFDGVRVPAANRIGEENRAWSYAKFLLDQERTYNAHIGRLLRHLQRIRTMAQERRIGRQPLPAPDFDTRLARLDFDVQALAWSVLRVLCAEGDDRRLAAAASALKVRGSHLLMRVGELEMDLLGTHALPRFSHHDADRGDGLAGGAHRSAPGVVAQFLYSRASTIFGGSNDIQRGIIWNALFRD